MSLKKKSTREKKRSTSSLLLLHTHVECMYCLAKSSVPTSQPVTVITVIDLGCEVTYCMLMAYLLRLSTVLYMPPAR